MSAEERAKRLSKAEKEGRFGLGRPPGWASPAFDEAVGALVREAADLEYCVATTMWGVVGLAEEAGRQVLPNSVQAMLETIKRMLAVRSVSNELGVEVRLWLAAVRAAYERRSVVVHSGWVELRQMRGNVDASDLPAHAPGTYVRRHLGRSVPLIGNHETITVEQIVELVVHLDELQRQWHRFLLRLMAECPGPWNVHVDASD